MKFVQVEFDESTQINTIQISVSVMELGQAIGVLIFGIKLTFVRAKYFGERHPATAK